MISNDTMIWAGKAGVVATVSAVFYKASRATMVTTSIFIKTIVNREAPSTFDRVRAGAQLGIALGLIGSGITTFFCSWENRMFSVTDNNSQDVERFLKKQLMYTIFATSILAFIFSSSCGCFGIKVTMEGAQEIASAVFRRLDQTIR